MKALLTLGKKTSGSVRVRREKSSSSSSSNSNSGNHEGSFLSEKALTAALITGDLRKLVITPKLVDPQEWIAINVFEFFHHVNLIYGTVADHCTHKNCPIMTAGDWEYLWGEKNSPTPAPQYIDYVMTAIGRQVDDEALFPTQSGHPFPRDFEAGVKTIMKRLFRVLAHIYHSHFDLVLQYQEEGHLNTLFSHLVLFANEHDLIEKREYGPMNALIIALLGKEHVDTS